MAFSNRIRLPRPRRQALVARALRAIWTFPTNALGWAACRLLSGRPGVRVGGPAATAWIYAIRPGLPLPRGAVTLGHHILYAQGMFDGRRGRLVLAHELAHTRQHDWLGPAYLPLHIASQALSALASLFAGAPRHSRIHDFNPLEQTFICIAAGATDAWPLDATREGLGEDRLLREFGV